jgi:hypothetical protein
MPAAEDLLDPPGEFIDCFGERGHCVQSSRLAPAGDIRDRLALDHQPNAAARDRGHGVHDHLGPLATVLGIANAKKAWTVSWTRIRSCAFAGTSASTTIRRAY